MEEAAEVEQLISAVVQSGGRDVDQHFQRYKSILTKYQEQPQLLDGSLEGIVQPLAVLLRQTAVSSTAHDTALVQRVCRMLHVLISVRGYKTVARFFPHEAADLERVLQVLGYVTNQAASSTNGSHVGGTGLWEAQAVLLLWLSILILSPFDLVILDSSVTDSIGGAAAAQAGYPPLAAKVMVLCQDFLSQPGAVREMAALLLARLLTRPDMPAALSDFIAWQQQALATAAGPKAVFLLPGVLQTLAQVYKLGRREQLLQWTPAVWQQLSALLADDAASGLDSNALARKLAVKLTQRVGLVMLPPQLAGWRYVRAADDMASNLLAGTADSPAAGPGGSSSSSTSDAAAAAVADSSAAPATAEAEAELPDIPAEVEDVLGVLLGSCSDRDTVVRWSAAKGVGRLAGCLPAELSEEVVQGVLGLLSPGEPDTSWHGGCLAIAELARRSILSPDLLSQVAGLLTSALTYDVRRGPHSVGAHVRDAAAYVCWALARSYEPCQLAGCVHALAASLLVVTCYDREVNCRRAAAAAFQECVGRLGSFPHGLEILAVADYYSVGNMASAYLRVAPFVARFKEYTQALMDHLLLVKLRHWDKAVRALAAMGLAALALVAAPQLASQCLPQLLQLVTDDVLEVRCGAVLGVAELLPALGAAGQQQLEGGVSLAVVQVLDRLEGASCYKGKGGELMREMAARLVQQVAAATAGLQVVPLYGGTCSSSSSKRHKAEADMEQQQDSKGASPPERADNGSDGDSEEEDVADDSTAQQEGQQQQQECQQLSLPLTPEFHSGAVSLLLDCISHVQDSIQAAGVSALQAYSAAFQQQRQAELLQVVDNCCRRLSEREAAAAMRRGAAAALGVMPAQLLGSRAKEVLGVLVSAVQEPLDPVAGFVIEARIAAVSSLAQLAQEVITSSRSRQHTPLEAAPDAAATAGSSAVQQQQQLVSVLFLKQCVVPALLAALRDYSRDNRGDVGSWVREAAMDGTTQLLLVLGTVLPSAGTDSAAAAAAGGGWAPEAACELHASLAVLLVSHLLQQSLERIARLRESALVNLQAVLQQPAAAAAVPGAATIAAALPGDSAELAGVASLACVARLAALLQLPWYRPAVLEGLVASIGGVDASLAKEASLALLAQVCRKESSSSSGTDSSNPGEGNSAEPAVGSAVLRASVAGLLLQLWRQEAGSARLSLPLIKSAALLLTHADFAGVPASTPLDPGAAATGDATTAAAADAPVAGSKAAADADSGSSSFAWGVLQQLKVELKGCGDVLKLLEGASLLAQLACVPDCCASAIQTVMVMLVNRYPKVRRAMAEQLYLQMIAVQPEADTHPDSSSDSSSTFTSLQQLPGDDLEAALDVLMASAWDGPLEQVRACREELAAAVHVEIKTRRVAKVLPAAGATPTGPGRGGDQESYQSLLDDAARGGGY